MYKSRDASYRGTYGDKREVDTTLYLHYKLWRDLKYGERQRERRLWFKTVRTYDDI